MNYQPNIQDAIEWKSTDSMDQWTFIRDLVGGCLTTNPQWVEDRVDEVEEAFEILLSKTSN